MLCSFRELQLGDDHKRHHRPAGRGPRPARRAAEALGLDDPVIEIKVTPNRGDCLGVHGIARDLAGRPGLGTLKPVKADKITGSYKSPIKWTHGYEPKPDSPCPIVVGRHFRGLKNGPLARLAAAPAEGPSGCGPILDPGRYHQPGDLRPQTGPLHVFRWPGSSPANPRHAPGARRRADPGRSTARTYTARSVGVRQSPTKKGVHGHRRHHGAARITGVREDTTEVFLRGRLLPAHRQSPPPAASSASCSDARYPQRAAASTRKSCWWGAEAANRA